MLGKNIKSSVKFFTSLQYVRFVAFFRSLRLYQIDQVERLDVNDMKTLILVLKSLNEKDEGPPT
jgi:hypothetical protein